MNTTIARVIKLIDTNKARAAFLAPLVLAVVAALASWVISGDFNDNEIRAAVGGAILAAGSGIATYLQPAGRAEVEVPNSPVGG